MKKMCVYRMILFSGCVVKFESPLSSTFPEKDDLTGFNPLSNELIQNSCLFSIQSTLHNYSIKFLEYLLSIKTPSLQCLYLAGCAAFERDSIILKQVGYDFGASVPQIDANKKIELLVSILSKKI
jgi:hypothetical protein